MRIIQRLKRISLAVAIGGGASALAFAKSKKYDLQAADVIDVQNDPKYGTGYRVYSKDNQYAGVLIGTIHDGMNPRELNNFEQFFKRECANADIVFTEVPLAPMPGVEGALHHVLTTEKLNMPQIGLADVKVNMSIRQRSSIRIGDTGYLLPITYADLEQRPTAMLIGHSLLQIAASIANSFVNNIKEVQEAQYKRARKSFFEMYNLYTTGQATGANEIFDEIAFMRRRDKHYTEKMLSELANISSDSEAKFLTAVGASHLSGPGSMSDLLRDKGYILEPFNVYKEAQDSPAL